MGMRVAWEDLWMMMSAHWLSPIPIFTRKGSDARPSSEEPHGAATGQALQAGSWWPQRVAVGGVAADWQQRLGRT